MFLHFPFLAATLAAALLLASDSHGLGEHPASTVETVPDGMHDFDFLVGSWNVTNHRLKARLADNTDWEKFPGVSVVRTVLDGIANIDEIKMPSMGFSGLTIRLYDPAKKEWAIYWVNSQTGTLQPPVFGRFTEGRGVFYGHDKEDGKPVYVRYIWSDITRTSARWEQAFSTDDGNSWETNWVMEFTRAAA